jgi:hypothetical protein
MCYNGSDSRIPIRKGDLVLLSKDTMFVWGKTLATRIQSKGFDQLSPVTGAAILRYKNVKYSTKPSRSRTGSRNLKK